VPTLCFSLVLNTAIKKVVIMTSKNFNLLKCFFVAVLCLILYGALFLCVFIPCHYVILHIKSVKEAKPYQYGDQESGIGSETISVAETWLTD
jgi:hypothetical protein